jgi:hypothetical protein
MGAGPGAGVNSSEARGEVSGPAHGRGAGSRGELERSAGQGSEVPEHPLELRLHFR